MKPQARTLLAAILLTAPFAQADNTYDESALYNETYTQSLNVGSEAIDCLKARKNDCVQKAWESSLDSIGKVIDTPSGQRALEELLPQLQAPSTNKTAAPSSTSCANNCPPPKRTANKSDAA